MRKLFFSLSSVTVCGAALFVGCSSSSDSTTTPGADSGADAVTADTYVPPKDGSTTDTGVDAGGGCQTCSDFIINGPGALPQCTTGSPSSADLVNDWVGCVCNTDGGAGCGLTSCSATCASGSAPSSDCQTCIGSQCGAQTSACLADGVDAGPNLDAGDGGD